MSKELILNKFGYNTILIKITSSSENIKHFDFEIKIKNIEYSGGFYYNKFNFYSKKSIIIKSYCYEFYILKYENINRFIYKNSNKIRIEQRNLKKVKKYNKMRILKQIYFYNFMSEIYLYFTFKRIDNKIYINKKRQIFVIYENNICCNNYHLFIFAYFAFLHSLHYLHFIN